MRKGDKVQFCPKGHDTFVTGRSKNKHCKVCDQIYYLENKTRIDKRNKDYKKEHIKELKIKDKEWYTEHKDRIKVKAKEWLDTHREEYNNYQRKYQQEHPDKVHLWDNKSRSKRRKEDIYFRLQEKLRVRINSAIRKNTKKGSAVRDLGCSIEFFKQYIESKFYSNMTWNNWGTVWQLDHIIPLWKFDLTDREQFLEAINYKNMQPLIISAHKKKTAEEAKERAKLRKL